jgi:hypothetical protein
MEGVAKVLRTSNGGNMTSARQSCRVRHVLGSSRLTNIRNALTDDEPNGVEGLNKTRKIVITINDMASELRLGGQVLEEDHTLVQEGKQM